MVKKEESDPVAFFKTEQMPKKDPVQVENLSQPETTGHRFWHCFACLVTCLDFDLIIPSLCLFL